MMKASPTSPFIATKPQFLFQVLIVPLDAPTHMHLSHQVVQRDVVRQRRQVIFERIGVAHRPFDQQPLLGVQAGFAYVSPGVAHPDGSKAPAERFVGSRAPTDGLEGTGRQRMRQVLDHNTGWRR